MKSEDKGKDELFKSEKKPQNLIVYVLHAGHYIPYAIKSFFSDPFKEVKNELDVLDIVASILSSKRDDDSINQSQELVKLHRVIENTKARRRLEKWSLRVIAIYLFIVFLLVLSNYLHTPWFDCRLSIPEQIMIAILTTTTVNIIGLGLIVLRGHFLANEDSDSKKNMKKRKRQLSNKHSH